MPESSSKAVAGGQVVHTGPTTEPLKVELGSIPQASPKGRAALHPHGTAFLTDAIIVQRYIEVERRVRRVMVVEVRASMHSNELRRQVFA